VITLILEISPSKINESQTSVSPWRDIEGRRCKKSQTHRIETCLLYHKNMSYFFFFRWRSHFL